MRFLLQDGHDIKDTDLLSKGSIDMIDGPVLVQHEQVLMSCSIDDSS